MISRRRGIIYLSRVADVHRVNGQHGHINIITRRQYHVRRESHRYIPVVVSVAGIVARLEKSRDVLKGEPIIGSVREIDFLVCANLETVSQERLNTISDVIADKTATIVAAVFIDAHHARIGNVTLDIDARRLEAQPGDVAVVYAISGISAYSKITAVIITHR